MGTSLSAGRRSGPRRLLAAAGIAAALLLPALVPAVTPSAHAGWWDDLDKGEAVKLSDLVFEPDRFKGKVVTFPCIHHEPADIFSPYFTSFTPDKFFNFTCWLDGSPLWELDAFQRDDFPYLYMRRDHPQRDELFRVEPYARLSHLVSIVEARARRGVGAREILVATFPPGSVTGAPKLAAIEHVERLERFARGFYTGAIGTISADGSLALSVAIRTAHVRGGALEYFAGGGIVEASDPEREVDETELKARVLEDALATLRG